VIDLIVRNGTVVTADRAGVRDVAVEAGRIVAIGEPGMQAPSGVRTIDATGKIVVPGGVDPHTHLAHGILSRPDEPGLTMGPEDDTRGMAFGGTTTHIDFCFVRPGDDMQNVIETRTKRWQSNSYVDYAFHVTLAGALPLRTFDQIGEAVQAGFPSFKVFTTNILPIHPKRHKNRLDFGRIHLAMEKIAAAGGILVVHGEDEDLVQFNYERFRAEGRLDGTNMHLVHTKLSEQLAFRRTIALARAAGCGVYFVHTSAKEGVDAIGEARADGLPIYGETLHQYACFSTRSTTRRRAGSARIPIPR